MGRGLVDRRDGVAGRTVRPDESPLVKAGLVELEDLLAEDGVRDFGEVIRRKKLTVEQLVAGGRTLRTAEGIVARAKAAAAAAEPAGD
jgi:hypothetical protein